VQAGQKNAKIVQKAKFMNKISVSAHILRFINRFMVEIAKKSQYK
jgi:hypothetical protein